MLIQMMMPLMLFWFNQSNLLKQIDDAFEDVEAQDDASDDNVPGKVFASNTNTTWNYKGPRGTLTLT